jgi:hypothetical protein
MPCTFGVRTLLLALVGTLVGACPSLAHADAELNGVLVVSDFHLFDRDFNFESIVDPTRREAERLKATQNQRAYERLLAMLDKPNHLTGLVMNGDLFHAPSIAALEPDLRIERMVELLTELQRRARVPLHFNLGNHDLLMEMKGKELVPVAGFAEKFRAALEKVRPAIHLIGADKPGFGDYKAVFDEQIAGQKVRISHAPFSKTPLIEQQAEKYRGGPAQWAHTKVTQVDQVVEAPDGILRIQSDSHTPLADPERGVFNTGMLTVDEAFPGSQPTMLLFEDGHGRLYGMEREGPIELRSYIVPMGTAGCAAGYRDVVIRP